MSARSGLGGRSRYGSSWALPSASAWAAVGPEHSSTGAVGADSLLAVAAGAPADRSRSGAAVTARALVRIRLRFMRLTSFAFPASLFAIAPTFAVAIHGRKGSLQDRDAAKAADPAPHASWRGSQS